jgi:CRISPR-associated endonuclease/helicase Cas3
VPQQLNRFRESSPDITLHLVWRDEKAVFCEKTERGEFVRVGDRQNIKIAPALTERETSRLWLIRDYQAALSQLLDSDADTDSQKERIMEKHSKRYGEINLPDKENQGFWYSDQFGFYPRKG